MYGLNSTPTKVHTHCTMDMLIQPSASTATANTCTAPKKLKKTRLGCEAAT